MVDEFERGLVRMYKKIMKKEMELESNDDMTAQLSDSKPDEKENSKSRFDRFFGGS